MRTVSIALLLCLVSIIGTCNSQLQRTSETEPLSTNDFYQLYLSNYQEAQTIAATDPDNALLMLKKAWNIAVDNEFDTLVPQILNSIGAFFTNQQQHDSALYYYRKVKSQDIENVDITTACKLYGNLAITYNSLGKNDSALYYANLSYDYAIESGDSAQIMKCLFDISRFENLNGNYLESIRLLGITEEYYLNTKNYNILAYTYNSLGVTHLGIESDEAALYYLTRAIEVDKLDDSRSILEYSYNNMGQFYRERKHDLDSALYYYMKAQEVAEEKGHLHTYLGAVINIGNVYEEQEKYIEARDCYLTAIRKPAISNFYQERTAVTINLGVVQLKLNELLSARVYLEEGLKMAQEGGYLNFQLVSIDALLKLEIGDSNAKAALLYLSQYKALKDSIQRATFAQDITEMKVAFETDAAQKKNEYLTQENILNTQIIKRQRLTNVIVIVGLIVLLGLLFYIINILKKQKVLYNNLHNYSKTIAKQNSSIEKTNKELVQVNQTKDKLFSIIAHDFRSPLGTIQTYLEILDDENIDFEGPDFKPLVSELRLTVDNTSHLLANLLEWALTQQQGIKNEPEKINLVDESGVVCHLIELNLNKKKQQLGIDIPADLTAWCDPQLFRNVLLNILNNATKFTPQNGLIQITAKQDDDLITVCVIDNGVGIEPENIDKLFNIDSGYHTNGTNEEKGTGLGLAMCLEYVETMGGSISVTSKVGEGSRFCFTIRASEN